jgi:hypothetical protein
VAADTTAGPVGDADTDVSAWHPDRVSAEPSLVCEPLPPVVLVAFAA